MWEQQLAFWVIALAMAGAAIGVVRSRNIVHCALFLVVVMAGAAAQYILIVADYIGAVIILFLFGIMLTRAPMRGEGRALDNDQRWAGAVVALFLFGVLTALLVDAFGNSKIDFNDRLVAQGSTSNVGTAIFRNYLVPFEVVSMLLLAALIGAIVLARRD